MQLVLPEQLCYLESQIKSTLLAAKQAGFAIDDFKLSFSKDQQIEIIKDNAKAVEYIPITTSSVQMPEAGLRQVSIAIIKPQGSLNLDCHYVFDKLTAPLSAQHLYIGAWQQGKCLDIYQALEQTYCIDYQADSLTPSYLDEFSKERHLAWLIVTLMLDFTVEDAALLAHTACLSQTLVGELSSSVPRETWPQNIDQFPVCRLKNDPLEPAAIKFPQIERDLGLYPVVDHVDWIEKLLKLGVKTIQLRIKDPKQADLEVQIQKAIELGREYAAKVFINDYWQLAIKHQAYGVHLGQEDIQVADLKAIAQAKIHLGLSTHSYFEIMRAKACQPSYIALGHIFPTTTKQMPSKPQGLTRLALYHELISGQCPSVAIGGIDLERAPKVWQTGVDSLAVVRAITEASDIEYALHEFANIMQPRKA